MHSPHSPPQSTPASAPFFTASVQDGCAHDFPMHTPLMQSLWYLHECPSPHRAAQEEPPQSRSDSSPFVTLSTHVGALHVFVP
jgi:hypothetical protein